MSTVHQNLYLSLKESVVTIRNFLEDLEMKQVADKKWLKKLQDLALDVDSVLDELKIEMKKHKQNSLSQLTPENHLNQVEIGKGLSYYDPHYQVDTENEIEKNKLTTMAGSAIIPTIKVLADKLVVFPMAEVSLQWNLRDDLERLKRSVVTILIFLEDAEMKQVSDKPTKQWLQKLHDAAFAADYVFEELTYDLVRSKVHKMKNTSLTDFFSPSDNQILFRRRIGMKVKQICEELKEIDETARGLGLQMRQIASPPARRQTNSYNVKEVFVGRDSDVRTLVDMVRSRPAMEQTLSVLPIVGMGGLGKTSLARRVFNDDHIVSYFGKRMWVPVSANFEAGTVFKDIHTSLMPEGNNVNGALEQGFLQMIQDKLRHRTYLLVLDDVWFEDALVWDSFIDSLCGVSFGKGNVVIITTRIEKIIHSITEPLGVHKLGELSNDDCWRIIKAKANLRGGGDKIHEAIGRSLAARCRGLPLAALVIGCWLRGRSPPEWLSIESKWIADLANPISAVLKLSFDNLSTPALKKCFAYTAIIPKGHCVAKEELIQLWMAEGLLQGDQDAGTIILNELVQSSLLQVWERDHLTGDAKSLGMHDLVADLALSVLDDSSHQRRYLFFGSSPDQIQHSKNLRTLFLRVNISQDMMPKLLWLHTLILDGEDITELPVSIGKLIHLKYLDTANTRIQTLPESIGQLYLFQTLRAEHGGKSSLRKLPVAFKYLISLRHLHIPNMELPQGVGKLTNLQTLPYFPVSAEKGRQIVELGKLTNLGGELQISNLEKVGDMQEAERADLFHKPNIYKLKLVWKNEGCSSSSDDRNVLEGLKPHPNLKSLEIHGFKGTRFPTWIMSLNQLIHLKLSHCQECEEIPMLGQLPNLKCLILSHLTNVESIGPSFYGISGNEATVSVFPKLERLELMGLQNLRVWEEVKSSTSSSSSSSSSSTSSSSLLVFPHLEVLVITKCRRLESAPSEFPCLKEFEIFSVASPLPLANICGSNLSTLRILKVWKVDGLVSLPDGLFSRNQDLTEATIRQCQRFTNLGNCGSSSSLRKLTVQFCLNLTEFADVASLNALEELDLLLCPNLRSIPYSYRGKRGSSCLRKLNIETCHGLTSLPIEMIEASAPTLEMFWLKKSQQQLMQMSILQKMPRLTIMGYEIPEQTTDVDACMPTLHSVSQLTIYGAGKNAIPERLQYYTSLHCLSLNEFGMEALPEWLGSMPSLKTLYLTACPKLRCLPFFNNVLDLSIDHCPLLTKALEPPNINVPHSQCSNISHIPNIRLDFQALATTSAPVLLDFFKVG